MTLFPFFMNIEGKAGILTGGGKHALEKLERILPYGPKLTLYTEEACDRILELVSDEKNQTVHLTRKLEESDLDTYPAFVIVAGEDDEENHQIAAWCRERRIMVNVVDDQEYCDFIFPSLIAHGSLSIGICTNGASPSTGVLLKRKIQQQIPEHIEEILDFLQEKRGVITETFRDNKKKRFAFYYELSEQCMALDRPMTEEEFQKLLKEF